MIRHFHKDEGDNTVWHDGDLVECAEIEYFDLAPVDGVPARMAVGFSCSRPDQIVSVIDNVTFESSYAITDRQDDAEKV